MKTRFSNNKELAHVWASQKQSHGEGNHMYFSRESIFSYGSHFEIARIVKRKGQTAVLYTTRSYSSATAKHKSYTARAISHLTTFHVPLEVGLSDKAVWLKSYRTRLESAIEKAANARTSKAFWLEDIQRIVTEANAFAAFFGLKSRLEVPADLDAAIETARVAHAAAEKRLEAKKRAAEEKQRVEDIAKLEEWKRGERDNVRITTLPIALRIKGDEMQTSLGAAVPVDHAQRAFKILAKIKERGETFHTNGTTIHVGHWDVEKMDETGMVKVGCHEVAWDEIQRLATVAGWV